MCSLLAHLLPNFVDPIWGPIPPCLFIPRHWVASGPRPRVDDLHTHKVWDSSANWGCPNSVSRKRTIVSSCNDKCILSAFLINYQTRQQLPTSYILLWRSYQSETTMVDAKVKVVVFAVSSLSLLTFSNICPDLSPLSCDYSFTSTWKRVSNYFWAKVSAFSN